MKTRFFVLNYNIYIVNFLKDKTGKQGDLYFRLETKRLKKLSQVKKRKRPIENQYSPTVREGTRLQLLLHTAFNGGESKIERKCIQIEQIYRILISSTC